MHSNPPTSHFLSALMQHRSPQDVQWKCMHRPKEQLNTCNHTINTSFHISPGASDTTAKEKRKKIQLQLTICIVSTQMLLLLLTGHVCSLATLMQNSWSLYFIRGLNDAAELVGGEGDYVSVASVYFHLQDRMWSLVSLNHVI